MREGWLVDPGTKWLWRLHRDDKAWVRAPRGLWAVECRCLTGHLC
ncbi:DUF1651 domain-containing protein [Prochlorococcus sp. MIT 1303]|nr:DUF1651 domain-containing protein [Prochlorococcus sp. MIT 1303]